MASSLLYVSKACAYDCASDIVNVCCCGRGGQSQRGRWRLGRNRGQSAVSPYTGAAHLCKHPHPALCPHGLFLPPWDPPPTLPPASRSQAKHIAFALHASRRAKVLPLPNRKHSFKSPSSQSFLLFLSDRYQLRRVTPIMSPLRPYIRGARRRFLTIYLLTNQPDRRTANGQ